MPAYPVEFPHLWEGQIVGNDTLTNLGYATYRLRLMLDLPHPPVSLMLEDSYTAYTLFVNGKIVATNGKVGSTREDAEPEWLPQTINLPTDTNQYDLILQVANFEHFKGGLSEPIAISTLGNIKYHDLERKAFSLMLTGSLILGGLFFIGLYWFGRNDLSMFFFSMFCLIYTYRIIGTDYYVLHQIIPDIPWILGIRLEYISLYLSVFMFVQFIYSLFPDETSKTIRDLISFISISLAVVTLVIPPFYFSQLITPYFMILIGLIVYGIVIFIQAYIHDRPGAQYAVLSVLFVLLVFTALIADYFGWYSASDGVLFFGYISFFFSQSLILSYRFSKRLKDSLLESQEAIRVKTDFLSTISHELRTPLNAITGMTRLLEDNKPRKDQLEFLKSLKLSSNNLIALVNDILDFSKIEKGDIHLEKISFKLNDVFDQAATNYELVAHEKGLEFNVSVDPRFFGLKVVSDQTRLNQVLNNLISNAIKFTDQGKIELKAEWIEEDTEHVTIHVEVEDTGLGIPADKLESIFYQFTQLSASSTREFGGVGLGLSIVRNILHAFGSKITVASALGEGSRFGFVLFLEKAQPTKKTKPKPVEIEAEKSSYRVLLVDDNLMNSMIAEQFLKGMRYAVDKCENGQEAVNLAIQNEYDLVLMDIHMPVKDGYQAAAEILSEKPHQKILALTASISSQDMEKLDRYGFVGSLIKPFRKEQLENTVKSMLHGG